MVCYAESSVWSAEEDSMMGWGDALFEVDYKVRRLEAERQHDRLVQIALGAASRREKESLGRRLGRRMGGLMAGLWCRLGQRLTTRRGTAAC
jgi:hypothetical protein